MINRNNLQAGKWSAVTIVLIELDEHLSHLCCTAEYTFPNYNLDDVIMAVHSECYAFGPIECQERPLKILTKS